MGVAKKIIESNDQPQGGKGIVGIGGSKGLDAQSAINDKRAISPFPPMEPEEVDQPWQVIDSSLSARYLIAPFGYLLSDYSGASAAYSLRDLSRERRGQPVVRLRRASDNDESDFVASDLTGGVTGTELIAEPNFASSTGWSVTSGWVISGGTATLTSTTGNNFISSDAVADHDYYLMTITIDSCSDFTEAGLRIASNNYRAFSDFGITTAGTYTFVVDRTYNDVTALARFFEQGTAGVSCVLSQCSLKPYTPTPAELWAINVTTSFYPWKADGSFDGLVATWYDQSGGGNDATQSTAVEQPKLITAGVTEIKNGNPAIVFDGVDDVLGVSSDISSALSAHCLFAVSDFSYDTGAYFVRKIGGAYPQFIVSGMHELYNDGSSWRGTGGLLGLGDQSIATWELLGPNANSGYSNGIVVDDSVAGNQIALNGSDQTIGIGGNSAGSNLVTGNLQELIIYPSDQSANRTGIEQNINDHFNIF